MAFKVLHRLLVLLRRRFRLERAEISSFPRVRIFLAGIQPILAGFKFPNHGDFSVARGTPMHTSPSRVSTLKVFKFILAGPFVTLPMRTSKQELCHGHCTLQPLAFQEIEQPFYDVKRTAPSNIRTAGGLRAPTS
jgi:hypothetical protein